MGFKAHKVPAILASVAAIGLLMACGGGGSGGGTGTLAVSMTDAPACGFSNVYVTVNKIRVHRSASAEGNDGGWSDITLNPARKIDLLELTNGVTTSLGEISLPAGRYTQMRLVLDRNTGNNNANSVIRTGSTSETPLDTPSGTQSGIKLIHGFDVGPDQKVHLVLDFDACKSVVTKGNGGLALKPVIKVLPAEINGIEGYINNALLSSNVMVTAQQNGEVISGTVPDTQGRFHLTRLVPGEYDVVITADDRATAVITKVPVQSTTSTVRVSESTAPITLQSSTPNYGVTGTVNLNPASTSEAVAYVSAKQSFSVGPTVTVKYRGVDVSSGLTTDYAIEKLPSAAPMLGQYSATLPITFAAEPTSLGAGSYTLEAAAVEYQKRSMNIDVSTQNSVQNFTLSK